MTPAAKRRLPMAGAKPAAETRPADGSVLFLPTSAPETMVRALITAAGGESIERNDRGRICTQAIGFCDARTAEQALLAFTKRLDAGEPLVPTATDSGSSPAPLVMPTLERYFEDVFLPVVKRDKAPKTYESAGCSA